jgi:hypothetical protein
LARGDEPAVLARDADRAAALGGDPGDDLLVDRTRQDHLGDLHRRRVGDAQPVDEAALDALRLERGTDLRAAAMDDDRVDADRLQQHDILGEILGRIGIAHGMAAIFHDEGRALIALQIGQCFGERFGLGEQSGIGSVIGHGAGL